jgi:DNA transformation protein
MSQFADYLHEIFRDFGPIRLKRMFGGWGVYADGLMFGLVVDDLLYLKADAHSAGDFLSCGLKPFEYSRQGKRVALSYYAAPEEILEDPEQAALWARRALDAALRAEAARSKRMR